MNTYHSSCGLSFCLIAVSLAENTLVWAACSRPEPQEPRGTHAWQNSRPCCTNLVLDLKLQYWLHKLTCHCQHAHLGLRLPTKWHLT